VAGSSGRIGVASKEAASSWGKAASIAEGPAATVAFDSLIASLGLCFFQTCLHRAPSKDLLFHACVFLLVLAFCGSPSG